MLCQDAFMTDLLKLIVIPVEPCSNTQINVAGAIPKLHFKFIWCQQTMSLHFTICIWLVLLLLCCVMSQVQEHHEIGYHF